MKLDRDASLWVPAGAACGLTFLGLFSIGVLILPFAAGLTLLAATRTRGRGVYGFLVGAGGAIAGVCLPQAPYYTGLGLFGLGLALCGVAVCLTAHRLAAR
jgi:hypothetical protein